MESKNIKNIMTFIIIIINKHTFFLYQFNKWYIDIYSAFFILLLINYKDHLFIRKIPFYSIKTIYLFVPMVIHLITTCIDMHPIIHDRTSYNFMHECGSHNSLLYITLLKLHNHTPYAQLSYLSPSICTTIYVQVHNCTPSSVSRFLTFSMIIFMPH